MCNKIANSSFLSETYDFVFSLGGACFCSGALRESNRQFRSFPFDWVAGASIIERAQFVANGFENWLSPEALVYVGEQNLELEKKHVYRNTITDVSFIHDFPQTNDFTASYAKVKEKYDRRINRLYKNIRASKKALAVYMGAPDSPERVTDAELHTTRTVLDSAFPGVEVDLLYVYNEIGYTKEEIVASGIYKAGLCFTKDASNTVNRKCLSAFCHKIRLSWKLLSFSDLLQRYRIFYIKKSRHKTYSVVKLFRIPVWKYTNK